ncbi:MAG: hypothetical protein QM820_39115 [Minicystis sp.]
MAVFSYDAFGPQALAGQLIGEDCYGACCCMEYGDAFDVRVVVYQGVTEAEVRGRYVTAPDVGEYRLVTASDARRFVTEQLAELERWPSEDRLPSLEQQLRDTRDRLARELPEPATR